MATIVEFDEWASAPGFDVQLRGRTYKVPPRSVDDWALCASAAALGEHNLGLVAGDLPDGVREAVARIKPGDHPALGREVYAAMLDDGLPPELVDRVAYYAVFLVARGKRYADALASLIWPGSPGESGAGSGEPAPKG